MTLNAVAAPKHTQTVRTKVLDSFLAKLSNDIACRRIARGISALVSQTDLVIGLDPSQENSARLVGHLAQWVDVGFDGPKLIKGLLARFSVVLRGSLRLSDYAHLRMAEGFSEMSEEHFDSAVHHFEDVLSFGEAVLDKESLAIANFWIARCQRRLGRYDDAMSYTLKGEQLAETLGYPRMAAVMKVLESWLIFQRGESGAAESVLKQAEASLSDTDDYVTLGNIQSAYGRIARRQGKYDRALEHFIKATEKFSKRDAEHRNVARSLLNIAFVKRLIALRLRKTMDKKAERGWKRSIQKPNPTTHPTRVLRARFERLREDAFSDLAAAKKIYSRYDDHRGIGSVHINAGYLHLDSGDLDQAAAEASKGHQLGEERNDHLLMARARTLQSAVENAKFEEQIEEHSDPSRHARLACDYARDAVDYAKHTQNRRLLAKTYIAQGLALSNDFFNDMDAARQCADKASVLLKPEGQDYVWEELQVLRKKLLRAGSVDVTLREWSQGLVGEKTLRQITGELEAIVIPQVWRREDQKIIRVAKRLSVSPKKVRRILTSLGLLNAKRSSRANPLSHGPLSESGRWPEQL